MEPVFTNKLTFYAASCAKIPFMLGSICIFRRIWSPFAVAAKQNEFRQSNRMGSKKLFLCSLEPNFCQNSTFAPVFAPVFALLPFQRDDCFEVRRAREQVEREYFLDAVAVAFPFLEGIRNFVGAAEDVADAYGLAHG